MKKRTSLLISVTSFSAVAVLSVIGATHVQGFTQQLMGDGETVLWNHYSAVAPSFEKKGAKEYWVSCSTHEHQLTAPTGNVEIVDKGAPSDAILKAILPTDDRAVARFEDMHIDFEDDAYANFVSFVSGNTSAISTEQAFSGTHSLKISATDGKRAAFRLSNEYYNRLTAEGISFRMYSADIFNADIASGPSVYNAGHDVGSQVNYWGDDQNLWENYVIPKSSLMATADDHYIFKLPAGKTIYIDDICPAYAQTDNAGFEDDRSLNKVVFDTRNTNTITSEKAFSGKYSLKVGYTTENNMTFLLSDAFYDSLPDEGIKFNVYADTEFNGEAWHYYKPTGEWKEVTVAKSAINAAAGAHYVGTLWASGTFYIDNVRPANFSIDYSATSFEDDFSYTAIFGNDNRNTAKIVSGTSYHGIRSMRIDYGKNNKTFLLSDEFYNSLPNDGFKFNVFSDNDIFNGETWKYFDPRGEWKEVTVAKSAINATAGYHYVGTLWANGTFYIDNIRPVGEP